MINYASDTLFAYLSEGLFRANHRVYVESQSSNVWIYSYDRLVSIPTYVCLLRIFFEPAQVHRSQYRGGQSADLWQTGSKSNSPQSAHVPIRVPDVNPALINAPGT